MAYREAQLFMKQDFTSHSGKKLTWKIECDAISNKEIETLGDMILEFDNKPFRKALCVGYKSEDAGVRIARYLNQFASDKEEDPVIIVDDVITTGHSMNEARNNLEGYKDYIGWAIFARDPCTVPSWCRALFTMPYKPEIYEDPKRESKRKKSSEAHSSENN